MFQPQYQVMYSSGDSKGLLGEIDIIKDRCVNMAEDAGKIPKTIEKGEDRLYHKVNLTYVKKPS